MTATDVAAQIHEDIHPIDGPIQTRVLQAVKISLQKRDDYYDTEDRLPVEDAPDEQEVDYEDEDEENDAPPDAVRKNTTTNQLHHRLEETHSCNW